MRGRVDGGAQHWLAAAAQEGSLAAARPGERERRERLCCEKVSTSPTAWRRSYASRSSSTKPEASLLVSLFNASCVHFWLKPVWAAFAQLCAQVISAEAIHAYNRLLRRNPRKRRRATANHWDQKLAHFTLPRRTKRCSTSTAKYRKT